MYTEDLTRTDNFRIRRAHRISPDEVPRFSRAVHRDPSRPGPALRKRSALSTVSPLNASEMSSHEVVDHRNMTPKWIPSGRSRFASLFVLHVLSTFLFSCVYVFTVTKEKKPRVIAVVSSSIIV